MQLDSPANLKRTKAVRITPKQIQKITTDLRPNDSTKITTAMEKLQRFDRRYEKDQERDS